MTAQSERQNAVEHHDTDAHDAHDDSGSHHGSFKDYLIGFVLAAVLTAIPFWIVIYDVFRNPMVGAVVILIFAFVQIVVHMVYFLHLNSKSEGGWTVLALIFTSILVVITLAGSLWVMSHLDSNMMPMSPEQMRSMP
jgi:cytochrome o ubiquinol oxidase operon protein cyoD